MKKILLVTPYFRDSYANHISMGSAVKIAENLSSVYQILVLTTGRRTKTEHVNKNLKVESVPGWLVPDPVNYMISFKLLGRFGQLLKTFRPDLVIVSKYMFFSSLVIPIAKLNKIKVITVTDTFPGINWFSSSLAISVVMWLYARIIGIPLLWLSERVVLLYPGLEDIARRYKLKYITIPNGVEARYFGKIRPPADIIKPQKEFWVGFVGRPESAKGYAVAQQIADQFAHQKHIRFVFVGDPYASGSAKNRLYLGFRRDIMNIFPLFDCLILPSRAEGLPNVVMEAMSQRVPVIANAVGGVNHLLKNNINGIMVTSQSIPEFISAITLLKNNPKARKLLGKNAQATIKNNFNWDNILLNYCDLIEKVCAA